MIDFRIHGMMIHFRPVYIRLYSFSGDWLIDSTVETNVTFLLKSNKNKNEILASSVLKIERGL